MESAESRLSRLARGVVEPLGYELVAVELFRKGASRTTLRVYIDQEKGVGLEDCAAVSEQLSAVLDVEDPLPGNYDLEVSSPGLDRPLVNPEHFERFVGSRARIRLSEKLDGRRNLEGILQGCSEGCVHLVAEGRVWTIPLEQVEMARLVPSY
ncbi:MAG: ribosome maturation factor RimP [Thiocapsa sp.]|nr:ribosome maturation factor RimP [Thiocapsa sp.]MCG6896584.1 ribosome maturation factor RimP [Thiocapsa sp.]MCG6985704.1 ribosome maturation factor RimP [Thiocapsa sp.]